MDSMALTAEVKAEFVDKLDKKRRFVRLLKQMREKHDSIVDRPALDDVIISDTMVLCVDQEYNFSFRSKDVIHSAYFPHFRAQMNTVPGMTTRLKFTPTETTADRRKKEKDSDFEFWLICNKVCGKEHKKMKLIVRVVDAREYLDWLSRSEQYMFKNQSF